MRRLPVLQDSTTDDAVAASRPPWHWSLIGAGFTLTAWAPLAALSVPLGARLAARITGVTVDDVASGRVALTPHDLARLAALSALPIVLSFALAAGLAGGLVGRFGGHATRRNAALGGLTAAAAASVMAFLAGGRSMPPGGAIGGFVALGALGAIFGAAGAMIGLRTRPSLGGDSGDSSRTPGPG